MLLSMVFINVCLCVFGNWVERLRHIDFVSRYKTSFVSRVYTKNCFRLEIVGHVGCSIKIVGITFSEVRFEEIFNSIVTAANVLFEASN